MEFGVLFTSHPNPREEPYPHRDVPTRTTDEAFAERVILVFRPPARRAAAE